MWATSYETISSITFYSPLQLLLSRCHKVEIGYIENARQRSTRAERRREYVKKQHPKQARVKYAAGGKQWRKISNMQCRVL